MTRRVKIKSDMLVMAVACSTCPFSSSKHHIEPDAHARYTQSLVTFQGQHLCHTVNNKKICRGGRDTQLKVLCALGILTKPTDDEFNKKKEEVLNNGV